MIPRSLIRNNQVYIVDAQSRLVTRAVSKLYDQRQFTVIDEGVADGDLIVASDLIPAVDGMLLEPEIDVELQNSLQFGD